MFCEAKIYRTPRVAGLAGVVFLTLIVSGCGPSGPPFQAVSGRILIGVLPLTKGTVLFRSEASGPDQVTGSGELGDNGAYEIHAGGKTGLPVGRYRVTVFTGKPGMPSKDAPFDPKYSSQESPLFAEVKAKAEPGSYDFKLEKQP